MTTKANKQPRHVEDAEDLNGFYLATNRTKQLPMAVLDGIKRRFPNVKVETTRFENKQGVEVDQITLTFPETPAHWFDRLKGDEMIFKQFAVVIEPLED